jgi:hypothetical protein
LNTQLEAQALSLIKAGENDAAIALLTDASLEIRASEPTARLHALALAQSGRTADALMRLAPVLNSASVSLQSRSLAARLFEDEQRYPAAFEQYSLLVNAMPAQVVFWRGLWRITLALRDEVSFRRALDCSARLGFDVSSELTTAIAFARCARRFARGDEIERCLQTISRAAAIHHDDAQLRWLHTVFVVDAKPCEAASLIAPLPAEIVETDRASAALWMPNLYADEPAIDYWRARYASALALIERSHKKSALPPETFRFNAFTLAYHGRNDLALQSVRGDLLASIVAPTAASLAARRRGFDASRIRVGFVSKHIRDCTVGQYFKRFMTDLRDARCVVEVFAIGQTDAFTDDVSTGVDCLYRISLGASDDDRDAVLHECARKISERTFDVLIYPEIGMEPLIEKLAAMRLAPIQCALWGHPDTTGLPTIDVFFSAESMEPANAQSHYRERLQLLPNLGCAYPKPPVAADLSRRDLGLPLNVPLAVCAQSSFKWRARFVDAVAKILRATPQLVLLYFENRDAVAAYAFEQYLKAQLRDRGIDATSRTIGLRETTREAFLAVLKHCDVALDTFDFSGGNTTLDSLSVGLPVVTLPGEFMRGRQSMAMLERVGANELIARDVDDYVTIATSLLADEPRRDALRSSLVTKSRMLFDDPAPIIALREWLLISAHSTIRKRPF